MTILKDYKQFSGRHWETGSVHNVLAYQGVQGPHNGQPLSEAMLLGISGGITFGYFLFHYEGFDPQLALLTRNTFDPLQTLLERLGVVQTVQQTGNADKGLSNLMAALDNGQPAIVWADMMHLPYNASSPKDEYWAMMPIVIYGHDENTVYISDRSSQPLTASPEELATARGRIKKDKFRVLTLDLPGLEKLHSAVDNGIWQCIRLYTEAPPKGAKKNFGLAALDHWADMLVNRRNQQSWARFFAPGRPLFAALVGNRYSPGLYGWVQHYGSADGAERGLYADFLDEAAALLDRPSLRAAATTWRTSAQAWRELSAIALPEDVPLFKQARQLLDEGHDLFVEQGAASLERRQAFKADLNALREAAGKTFPLNDTQASEFCAAMAQQVLKIRALEGEAVEQMQAAMA